MSRTLEEKFTEEWPEFFRDVECGFYLPGRWEYLVWTLCNSIAWRLTSEKIPLSAMKVAQVKEKFGGLRFYYDLDLEDEPAVRGFILGAVHLAESLSFKYGEPS
jgi:hypothetical protein